MASMPNVLGLNIYEAQASLTAAGVYKSYPVYQFLSPPQIRVAFQKSSLTPGDILAQIPAAAQTVALGTPITLLVSSFPMSVAVDAGMVVINLSGGEFIFGVSDFGDLGSGAF